MNRKRLPAKFYVFLVLTVLWMLIIFRFSAQSGEASEEASDGIVETIFVSIEEALFDEPPSPEAMAAFSVIVRKGAHLTEYLLLGVLLTNTLCCAFPALCRLFFRSGALCVLYAVSDELHQYFVPGRSCQLRDVCIDAVGACIGVLLVFAGSRKRIRKRD